MINVVTIVGYVKYLKKTPAVTTFKLSVNRGKKGERDNQKRFFIPVKVFGDASMIQDDQYVCISGELDSHKYQEKDFFEVLCNAANIFTQRPEEVQTQPDYYSSSNPPGYPVPPSDYRQSDSIPF